MLSDLGEVNSNLTLFDLTLAHGTDLPCKWNFSSQVILQASAATMQLADFLASRKHEKAARLLRFPSKGKGTALG